MPTRRSSGGVTPGGSDAATPAFFGALRHRNFRLFFAGHLVSLVGFWMHQVAQPWLVLDLTGSPFYVGLVSALSTFPVTLFSLYGGVVADRFPKRTVVVVTQLAAAMIVLALSLVVFSGIVRVWHVMVTATLLGVVAAFDMPGRQAFLVELVGKRDLMNAIALNSSAFSASRVIGPGIGGVVIGAVGIAYCFLANAVSYLAVVVALLAIRVSPAPVEVTQHSAWSKIREGLAYVAGDRRTRALIIMIATNSVFGFSFQVLLPVLARDVLEVSAAGYGSMLSAAGVGALAGALSLAGFGRMIPKGKIVAVAAVVFGLQLVALGFVRWFPGVLVTLGLMGFAMIMNTATTNTLLQTMAPDDLRGRVMSVYTLAFIGLMPFGAILAGTLADQFGPPLVFALGGVVCTTVAVVTLKSLPELRSVG